MNPTIRLSIATPCSENWNQMPPSDPGNPNSPTNPSDPTTPSNPNSLSNPSSPARQATSTTAASPGSRTIPSDPASPGTKSTPATQSRHCASCQKTVVDFTAMDDHELLQWFSTKKESVCGRLRTDQLDRALTPLPSPRKNHWRYWNYLIAGLLFSSEAAAQTKSLTPLTNQHISIRPDNPADPNSPDRLDNTKHPASTDSTHRPDNPTLDSSELMGLPVLSTEESAEPIRGKLIDSSGQPLSFATIIFGPKQGVVADTQGYFSIPPNKLRKHSTLTITQVGYETTTVDVKQLPRNGQIATIVIPEKITILGEVVTVKAVSIAVRKPKKTTALADTVSFLKDTLASIALAKPALTAYPNPVARGGSITISTRLDHTGQYSLQLYSSTGALVESREIHRSLNTDNLAMPIPAGLVPGIYFVKLSHPAMTKCYSQQIMVY